MDHSTIRSLETVGAIPAGERRFKGVNAGASSLRKIRRARNKHDRQAVKRILVEMNRELRSIADRKGVRLGDFPKPAGRTPILGDLLDWLDVEAYTDDAGTTRFRERSGRRQ